MPDPEVQTALTVLAALEPVGTVDASLAEDGDLQRDAEFNVAHHAVPASMLAVAAGAVPDGEFPQQDGISTLKDLRIGDARVGHVDVYARGAGPVWTCTTAPSNGLVVAEAADGLRPRDVAAEAKGEVVAAALAGGAGLKGLEDDVGDALAGEHVAAHDGCAGCGRENRLGRDLDCNGPQTPLVERDVVGDETTEAVDDGAVGDCLRSVDVAVYLRSCAVKVEFRTALVWIDGDAKADRRAVVHVVDCLEGFAAEPGMHVAEEVADTELSILLDVQHVELDRCLAVLGNEALDERDALLVGRDLRAQVIDVVAQRACTATPGMLGGLVVEELHDALLVEFASTDELLANDGRAFLIQLPRVRRHAPCRDATYIGVVRSRRRVEEHLLACHVKGRHHERHIRKVRAPVRWVVGDDDVALSKAPLPNLGLSSDARRHGAQVDRQMRRIGYQSACGVENGTREVKSFFDIGADAGLL